MTTPQQVPVPAPPVPVPRGRAPRPRLLRRNLRRTWVRACARAALGLLAALAGGVSGAAVPAAAASPTRAGPAPDAAVPAASPARTAAARMAADGRRGWYPSEPAPGRPAMRVAPTASRPARGWRGPLDGRPPVTRRFAPPATPYGAGHRGVDLAAAPGAVVRAVGPGVVLFAGVLAGRGVVSVRHAGGLRTTYEPLQVAVRPGQAVPAGAALGRLVAGHPGCPAAACLHWGLLRGDVYLNPLSLLGLVRVRLLPLGIPATPASGVPSGGVAAARIPVPGEHGLGLPAAGLGVGVLGAGMALLAARRPP